MTFFQFISIYLLTHISVIAGHIIINRIEHQQEQSLKELFESGALSSDIPIAEQLSQMDEDCPYQEIESIDSDLYDLVDIDAVKKRLRIKNERLREVVLEVR